MKKIISTILVLVILINSILAQGDLFTSEEIEILEEELAEEIIIIEDRAGTTPDDTLYVIDEVVEDITLTLKKGEDKAAYALDVKEEKIAEALVMTGENKSAEAWEALEKANNVSDIVIDKVGLKLGDAALKNIEISEEMLENLKGRLPTEEEWKEVEALVNSQSSQEKKIKLATNLAKKVGSYCDELAELDFRLMEADKHCDPGEAPEWLQEFIEEELKERQEEAEETMIEMLTTCINDPRDCDCSQIPVRSEQQECERNVRLAIKCEFEMDISACEQLDAEPKIPEGIPDFLKPIFEETITELIAKKEKEMFTKFAPPECIEAGLDNREDCEKLMVEKYIPPECKEAGAFTREECESLMMERYGSPPEECMKEGRPLSKEECEAVMIEKLDIPDECMRDGHPIGEEECMAIMLPPECKEAGAYSREECEKIMIEMYVPEPCKEAGAFTPEECEKVMREKMEEGVPVSPGYPSKLEGKCLTAQECAQYCEQNPTDPGCWEELPEKEKSLVEEKWQGYEVIPVREDLTIIKNPEGKTEIVTKEEAKKWIEENIGEYVEEEIVPGEELDSLKKEIEEMKEWKEEGIPPGLEEPRLGLEKEREEEKEGWEKEERKEIEMPEEEVTVEKPAEEPGEEPKEIGEVEERVEEAPEPEEAEEKTEEE